MRKKAISITIAESLYKQIKTQADKMNISVSAYITLLVQGKVKL